MCVDAKGQFTYWSARSNARVTNRGIRLDYFLCSEEFRNNDGSCPNLVDSYILHEDTIGVSDHCPIILIMEV